jgi:hypothetical protein
MLAIDRRAPCALLVWCAVLAACGADQGQGKSVAAASGDYAERTYSVFAQASHGAVQLEISTLATGPMSELRGQRLQDLLAPPDALLHASAIGKHINSAELTPRSGDEAFFGDGLVDRFEQDGHPLEQGSYRLLAIKATVGDRTVEYQALEASWPDFTIVADPVIEQVDAFGQIHAQLTEQGWSVQHQPLEATSLIDTSSVCALASHHNWGGETLTWGSYHAWWSDIFGLHLVDFYLGGQQAGISCGISGRSCVPYAFGYSNTSSCSAILGYSCTCKITGIAAGQTGSRMVVNTQTECDYTNPFSGSAQLSYSKNGVGASLTIDWSTHGAAAESFNGGSLLDSCGWF